MTASKPKAALGFIFITLLIDITGWGIIIPVIPKLIEQLIHGNVSQAARVGGWLAFAYAITQFVFAPLVGNLSDKYGRRPIILISLLGFSADYVLLSLAPSIEWLFVGRIIAGITGASFTTATAYIADVSTPDNRAKNFGLIGAAFGLGFILGPVIGGLLGQYGPRVPFYAAAVLCLLNFIYGWLILPESLAPEHRRPFEWKRANPIGAYFQLQHYPSLIPLILALFVLYVGSHAVQSNWNFFTMYRFKWTEAQVGLSLGAIGVLVALVQGGLNRWINPKLGNVKSIYVGLTLYTLGMLLFATATEGWMMYAFLIPYCLGGIAGPALQSQISGQVLPNQQGEIQGVLTSLMSASAIVGPPLMSGLFYHYTQPDNPIQLPGAPFILGGILMGISTLLVWRALRKG